MEAPKTPHFFKPLINPKFRNELLIPPSFFKHLKGEACDKAILKSNHSSKRWRVNINGRRLVNEGWSNFVNDHALHIGDFLVFRHEGNMVFHVLVFDPSTCEKVYPSFDFVRDEVDELVEENETSKGVMDSIGSKEIKKRKNYSNTGFEANAKKCPQAGNPSFGAAVKPSYKKSRVLEELTSKAKATTFTDGDLYFYGVIIPAHLTQYQMQLPNDFAKSNGLSAESNQFITLRYKNEESWQVLLRQDKCNGQTYLGRGWHKFAVGNGLQVGDEFKIELTRGENKLFLNYQGLDRRNIPREEITSKAKLTTLSHEYFYGTIRPSFLSSCQMPIPKEFARASGLQNKNCMMILRNKRGVAWQASLKYKISDGSVYIGAGWNDFAVKNGLRVGDEFKLELIKSGKILVMNYYEQSTTGLKAKACSTKGMDRGCAVKEEITSKAKATTFTHGESYLYGNIRPSHLKNYQLLHPTNFAKSNDLNNESNKMIILRIKNEGSWPVFWGKSKCGRQMYLGRGWNKFALENGLQVGDKFKLEIVKGENMIFMNYHGVGGLNPSDIKEMDYNAKSENAYFCGAIEPYNLSMFTMYIPEEFASANGLQSKCCMMILRNKKGVDWQVLLKHNMSDGLVYIGAGWKEFADENGLRVGDKFKLELIKGGKMLVMNYYGGTDIGE